MVPPGSGLRTAAGGCGRHPSARVRAAGIRAAGIGQPADGPPGASPPAGGGPPPPYGSGYGTPPPARPPQRRRTGLIIAAVIGALLIVCIGVAVFGGSSPDTNTSSNAPPPAGPSAAGGGVAQGLNQPVRDGSFEFTVTKVTCGKAQEGDQFGETAQGQFCEVALTVKNVGTRSQTLDGNDQKAIGPGGTQYSDDAVAEFDANSNHQAFLDQINPGNSVQGLVVFDIPKTATITSLQLHDSPFSDGVTVNVS